MYKIVSKSYSKVFGGGTLFTGPLHVLLGGAGLAEQLNKYS